MFAEGYSYLDHEAERDADRDDGCFALSVMNDKGEHIKTRYYGITAVEFDALKLLDGESLLHSDILKSKRSKVIKPLVGVTQ